MARELTIPIPPAEKFGPAMQSLTDRQRLFVCALFGQTKRDGKAAARAAGYEGDSNVLGVTAHRLTHNPKIIAAMKEEGQRRMDTLSALAIDKLGEVLEGATDDKTKLKAIDMVLNRTGFHQTTEHINRNETIVSDIEKIERITMLAKAMGLDPKTLLGRFAPKEGNDGNSVRGTAVASGDDGDFSSGDVVDAEYIEVNESNAGLEDLL